MLEGIARMIWEMKQSLTRPSRWSLLATWGWACRRRKRSILLACVPWAVGRPAGLKRLASRILASKELASKSVVESLPVTVHTVWGFALLGEMCNETVVRHRELGLCSLRIPERKYAQSSWASLDQGRSPDPALLLRTRARNSCDCPPSCVCLCGRTHR